MAQAVVKSVLRGSLDDLPTLKSRLVRIFISSTFTDTKQERNLLLEDVYPKLKSYCKEKHGLEFQVVDMRWGVPDEAADDHQVSSLCLQEIYNCQKLSTGPNFVAFLNQKHGSCPLQSSIDDSEFEMFIESLENMGEDTATLKMWYKKDSNASPAVYVLQPISAIIPDYKSDNSDKKEKAKDKWKEVYIELLNNLRIASKKCFEDGKIGELEKHKYFMSVTEEEIVQGILHAPGAVSDTCICIVRIIEDIDKNLHHEKVAKFIDITDGQIDSHAQNILSKLRDEKVGKRLKSIPRKTITWSEKGGVDKEDHADYLKEFGELFYTSVKQRIDNAVEDENNISNLDLYIEVLQHSTMAKERNAMFHGREDILEQVIEYLQGDSNQPLTVLGPSGCGKTSIMAQIARQVRFMVDRDALVILRFLGTSPDSSNIWRTLRSISSQILMNIGGEIADIPEDFNLLVKYFSNLLQNYKSKKPLILLLDSLDQLSPENAAHQLKWLPRKLPKMVKLVVSTYTDGSEIKEALKSLFPPQNFIAVPKLGEELSITILEAWLKGRSRSLNQEQFKKVHTAFKECSYPLFVNLVFEHVLSWRSYTPLDQCQLSTTIHDSINALFSRVQMKHGMVLVSKTFAYITASREGLSEIELEDILSLDEEVLEEVFLHHLPPYRRIPSLLLVRIRHDIMSYLSEKEIDESRVFFWYHRQFYETAKERYLNGQSSTQIHSMLADYFLGKWYGVPKPFHYSTKHMKDLKLNSPNGEADRRVSAQPIAFTYTEGGRLRKRYNKRMLNRLPYHLAMSGRQSELRKKCLYSYHWLSAKIKASSVQNLLHDFLMSKNESSMLHKILKAVQSSLGKHPETLGTEITGHLLPILSEKSNTEEKQLVEESLKSFAGEWRPIPYQVCYKPPSDALLWKLQHPEMPFAPRLLAVSQKSSRVLALAKNNTVICLDLITGEIEKEQQLLDPSICSLNIMFTDKHDTAIIGTSYQKQGNPVYLVSISTGEILSKLNLEKAYPGVGLVESLQFHLLKEKIVCVFIGHSVDIFDRSSGKLLQAIDIPAAGICISPDAKYLLIYPKKTPSLSVYNLHTYKLEAEVMTSSPPKNILLMNLGQDAVIQYDGTDFADLINIDPNDAAIGKSLGKVSLHKLGYASIQNIAVSMDGKYLIIKADDEFIIWNFNANKLHMQCKIPENVKSKWRVLDSAGYVTTDGYFLVTYETYLLIWNMKSDKLMHKMEVGTSRIESFIITPDCKSFITSTKRTNVVYIWEMSSILSSKVEYQPLVLKSSARYLRTDALGNVALCRGTTPTELVVLDIIQGMISRHLSENTEVMEPTLTPDGKYAILRKYEGDEVISIWSIQTGQLLTTLPLSIGEVKDYSCSNTMVAVSIYSSSGEQSQIGIWSIPDGKSLGTVCSVNEGLFRVFFEIYENYVIYTSQGETPEAFLSVYDTQTKQVGFTHKNVLRAQFLNYNDKACAEILILGDSGLSVVDIVKKKVVRKGPAKPETKLSVDKDIQYGIDKFRNVYDLQKLKFIFQFDTEGQHNFNPTRHTAPKIVPEGTHAVWLNITAGLLKFGEIKSRQTLGVLAIHSIPVCMDISLTGILMVGCEDGRIMMLQIPSSQHNVNEILSQSIQRQKTTKDKTKSVGRNANQTSSNNTKSKACSIL